MAQTFIPLTDSTLKDSNSTLVVKKSRRSQNPSIVLQEAKNDDQIVSLHLLGIVLTERTLPDLILLLESRKWKFVFFSYCGAGPCINCQPLARVLARTKICKLLLQDTVELTAGLLMEKRLSGIESLNIRHRHGLTNSQCMLLGKLVSASKGLKELSLRGTPIVSGALLAPGLAISYHLETLVLADTSPSEQCLADLVMVSKRKNSFQPAIQATKRLLSSRRSNLRVLDLSHLNLGNTHATILAQLLTENERLEQLNISFNKINDKGLEIFALKLPQMKHLAKVSLLPNLWTKAKPLCDAMQQNTSVEYLDSLLFLPEATMLRYYTTVNRGGRRLLKNSDSVPLGLWPSILERAGRIKYYVQNEPQARADAIYCLLKNGPVFFQK
jgi:hypothetical protein